MEHDNEYVPLVFLKPLIETYQLVNLSIRFTFNNGIETVDPTVSHEAIGVHVEFPCSML